MNKELFIRDLRRFLADLPEEERNAAIQYYEDYFNDAGPEREQQVIEELGSPVDIARQIKRTNADSISYGEGSAPNHAAAYPEPARGISSGNGQHTGSAFQGQGAYSQGEQNAGSWNNAAASNSTAGNWNNTTAGTNTTASSNSSWKTVFIVLVCIFAIPIGIPVLCVIFAFLLTILILIFTLIITFFATGVTLIASGIVTIVASFTLFPTGAPANALLGIGAGLILLSLGGWILWAGVLLCGKALPAFFRGIVSGIKSIRKRGN